MKKSVILIVFLMVFMIGVVSANIWGDIYEECYDLEGGPGVLIHYNQSVNYTGNVTSIIDHEVVGKYSFEDHNRFWGNELEWNELYAWNFMPSLKLSINNKEYEGYFEGIIIQSARDFDPEDPDDVRMVDIIKTENLFWAGGKVNFVLVSEGEVFRGDVILMSSCEGYGCEDGHSYEYEICFYKTQENDHEERISALESWKETVITTLADIWDALSGSVGPTVNFACTPTSVLVGEQITCACSAYDSGSGINTTTFTMNPSTSSVGVFVETCEVTNFAGKSASDNVVYTVNSQSEPPVGTEKLSAYFSYLSSSYRKKMVCGYAEDNRLEHYEDLGWTCDLTYKTYRSGRERVRCKCKKVE